MIEHVGTAVVDRSDSISPWLIFLGVFGMGLSLFTCMDIKREHHTARKLPSVSSECHRQFANASVDLITEQCLAELRGELDKK